LSLVNTAQGPMVFLDGQDRYELGATAAASARAARLPREVVAESQRSRILAAMVELVFLIVQPFLGGERATQERDRARELAAERAAAGA
jgi:hypothetical protein